MDPPAPHRRTRASDPCDGAKTAYVGGPGPADFAGRRDRLVSAPRAVFFTDQINAIMADVHRAERWLGLTGLLALAAMLVVGVWRWHRSVGKERLGST